MMSDHPTNGDPATRRELVNHTHDEHTRLAKAFDEYQTETRRRLDNLDKFQTTIDARFNQVEERLNKRIEDGDKNTATRILEDVNRILRDTKNSPNLFSFSAILIGFGGILIGRLSTGFF